MKGSEILVQMLKVYGVEFIFGVPGDTGTTFYEALYDERDSIQHIMARQERSAGYMADTYARLTGKTGICEAPSGGGATYLIPAVAEANDSSTPFIAITTDISLDGKNKNTLTDLDQDALFKPVTKWNTVIKSAADIPQIIRQAFSEANTGRPGAVHLSVPKNVLEEKIADEKITPEIYRKIDVHKRQRYEIENKKILNLMRKALIPVIIAGGGTLISETEKELLEFIEYSGIPVATTITGKGCISEEHPLSLGVIGGNGGRDYANHYVNLSDLVLFLGCKTGSVSTLNWSLIPENCKIIQIDIDPREVGRNYKPALGINEDIKKFLQQFLYYLKGNSIKKDWENSRIIKNLQAERKRWFSIYKKSSGEKIHPINIVQVLQSSLPDDSIIIVDPGTATPYMAGCYNQKSPGRRIIFPRAHGGLGYGLPGALAAKLAMPERPVFNLIGDGGAAFCIGELETALRLNIPAVFIVLNNGCFSWIKTLQHLYHDKKYFSVDFHPQDFSKIAEAFGIKGMRIEKPAEIKPAIEKVIHTKEPVLIDIVIDPMHQDIPPVHFWRQIQKK